MVLIDLQGKALRVGNKEIQRAYLGKERFYNLSSGGGVPMYDIEPLMAINASAGELVAYSGDLDTFLTNASGYTMTDDSLYFDGSGHIRYGLGTGITLEITIKNTLDSFAGTMGNIIGIGKLSESNTGSQLDLGYVVGATGLTYAIKTGNYILRHSITPPDTEYVTFAVNVSRYTVSVTDHFDLLLYVNGELVLDAKSVNSSRAGLSGSLALGSCMNSSRSRKGMFHMVDFKRYGQMLTSEEIKQSYEYVLDTL